MFSEVLGTHYSPPHILLQRFIRMALRQFVRTTAPKMGLHGSIPALSTSIARHYSTGEQVFRFPPDPSPPIFACFLSLPWRSCEDPRAPLRYPRPLATDISTPNHSSLRAVIQGLKYMQSHEVRATNGPNFFPTVLDGQNTKHAFLPRF